MTPSREVWWLVTKADRWTAVSAASGAPNSLASDWPLVALANPVLPSLKQPNNTPKTTALFSTPPSRMPSPTCVPAYEAQDQVDRQRLPRANDQCWYRSL